MTDVYKNPVATADYKASILAAFARIDEVGKTSTLIDSISDEDWLDESVTAWKIEAGNCESGDDELDGVDTDLHTNAVA